VAVAETVLLPAQPTLGQGSLFTPFGGDGRSSPLGIYDVDARIVGDASGGNAVITIGFDPRYTSLVGWAQPGVIADTAAGEFVIQVQNSVTGLPNARAIGTLPGVAEAFTAINSAYLWFPPPLYLPGDGRLIATFANVDATETYDLACQIYVFDRDVRQLTAMQWLNLTRVGVNAPTAS